MLAMDNSMYSYNISIITISVFQVGRNCHLVSFTEQHSEKYNSLNDSNALP